MWNKKYSECLSCKDTKRKHKALGYCISCYLMFRLTRKNPLAINHYAWNKKYKECLLCKGTKNKYLASGYCVKCYEKSPIKKASSIRYRFGKKNYKRLIEESKKWNKKNKERHCELAMDSYNKYPFIERYKSILKGRDNETKLIIKWDIRELKDYIEHLETKLNAYKINKGIGL